MPSIQWKTDLLHNPVWCLLVSSNILWIIMYCGHLKLHLKPFLLYYFFSPPGSENLIRQLCPSIQADVIIFLVFKTEQGKWSMHTLRVTHCFPSAPAGFNSQSYRRELKSIISQMMGNHRSLQHAFSTVQLPCSTESMLISLYRWKKKKIFWVKIYVILTACMLDCKTIMVTASGLKRTPVLPPQWVEKK